MHSLPVFVSLLLVQIGHEGVVQIQSTKLSEIKLTTNGRKGKSGKEMSIRVSSESYHTFRTARSEKYSLLASDKGMGSALGVAVSLTCTGRPVIRRRRERCE